MDKKIIIMIVIILIVGIIIGYFVLPLLAQPAGIGEEVFSSSGGVSPPALP